MLVTDVTNVGFKIVIVSIDHMTYFTTG